MDGNIGEIISIFPSEKQGEIRTKEEKKLAFVLFFLSACVFGELVISFSFKLLLFRTVHSSVEVFASKYCLIYF